MFRCQNDKCNKVCKPGQPQHNVVIETRDKSYERKLFRGKRFIRTEEVLGSEIVTEIKVCPDCYKEMTGLEPRKVQTHTNVRDLKETYDNKKRKPWQKRKPRSQSQRKEPQIQRINRKPNDKTSRNSK